MGFLNLKLQNSMYLGFGRPGSHFPALSIKKLNLHLTALGIHGEHIDPGVAGAAGCYKDRVCAVLQKVKMGIVCLDEGYVPIKAAVEGKISSLGIDIAHGIADGHSQHIVTWIHGPGKFIAEGRKAALVGSQLFADVRAALSAQGYTHLELLAPARAEEVIAFWTAQGFEQVDEASEGDRPRVTLARDI